MYQLHILFFQLQGMVNASRAGHHPNFAEQILKQDTAANVTFNVTISTPEKGWHSSTFQVNPSYPKEFIAEMLH